MGPKRGKKGTPWPEPRFADDPDIRAYVAAAIKDLEALKKHQETLEIGMPPPRECRITRGKDAERGISGLSRDYYDQKQHQPLGGGDMPPNTPRDIFSYVTASSESYVQAWGRKVPSNPPTVPSVGFSSGGSSPLTPYPSQEDLEVYLEHTDPDILNPIR
ncbi:hypothetical protein TSTA_000590 [Talaromyces stipitatus ATCC 10500]|uniref:Uncharacterized protein n=1 Tax=Talaromyces stipitatus (strain ATCC 10500 / CBS 375.48 / QM 6759 / NRRL 1006) TaxID=441959 RepID=B8MST9_TALSN|nr:uncharacterized protein TSTA_000590 [Talaromyces stipitatus ATCC 10500]EED11982.1 hypothetical protein TSTA_000590 [Talaromyces stipitatus ATCC 10500]